MKDYKKLSQIGLKARWDKEHNRIEKHIVLNHRKLKIEKARLIGFIMGDGSITSKKSYKNWPHHDIRFYPDDINLVKIFTEDFYKLYLKKPVVKKDKNFYRMHVSSKPAWKDLIDLTDFTSLEWSLPEEIIKSRKEKKEWIKALFDCEGYVGEKRIQIQSISKNGIHSIKNVLEEFNIKSSICVYKRNNPKWNINYILSINGKKNLNNFLNIGFNHSRKQKKLLKFADVPEW